jgi:hypothetical protein
MSGGSGRDAGGTLAEVPTLLGIGFSCPGLRGWGVRDER